VVLVVVAEVMLVLVVVAVIQAAAAVVGPCRALVVAAGHIMEDQASRTRVPQDQVTDR
jgi:hypothetical protein